MSLCKFARDRTITAEFAGSSHLSCRWNDVFAANIKEYLTTGAYPLDMPVKQRSNFARRASNFILQDGHLSYKSKIDGSLRLSKLRDTKSSGYQIKVSVFTLAGNLVLRGSADPKLSEYQITVTTVDRLKWIDLDLDVIIAG